MKKVFCIILVLMLCAAAVGEHEYIKELTDYTGTFVFVGRNDAQEHMIFTLVLDKSGKADIIISKCSGNNDVSNIATGTWNGSFVDCGFVSATLVGAWQDQYGIMWLDAYIYQNGKLISNGVYPCMYVIPFNW